VNITFCECPTWVGTLKGQIYKTIASLSYGTHPKYELNIFIFTIALYFASQELLRLIPFPLVSNSDEFIMMRLRIS
jgi:hypothetical protein